MNRRLKMALLALGVIGGYGSGFAHLAHCRQWHEQHRQQVMSEFAQRCTEAARGQGQYMPPPPPPSRGFWR